MDPAPDPAIFVIDLQVFCSLLFEGEFTSFKKKQKVIKINKTAGIKIFLTHF
jgi:hypothetical protein